MSNPCSTPNTVKEKNILRYSWTGKKGFSSRLLQQVRKVRHSLSFTPLRQSSWEFLRASRYRRDLGHLCFLNGLTQGKIKLSLLDRRHFYNLEQGAHKVRLLPITEPWGASFLDNYIPKCPWERQPRVIKLARNFSKRFTSQRGRKRIENFLNPILQEKGGHGLSQKGACLKFSQGKCLAHLGHHAHMLSLTSIIMVRIKKWNKSASRAKKKSCLLLTISILIEVEEHKINIK